MSRPTRLARPDDLADIPEVERAAGERFRTVGMDAVADDEPLSVDELARYQTSGRMWVAVDDADQAVAYCLVDVVDDATHLEQLTVAPQWARRGLGAQLIEVAGIWAARTGRPVLTLRAFRDVPWNAPYYRRLGFVVLPDDSLTPGLLALETAESQRGLTQWPRVAMRRG